MHMNKAMKQKYGMSEYNNSMDKSSRTTNHDGISDLNIKGDAEYKDMQKDMSYGMHHGKMGKMGSSYS